MPPSALPPLDKVDPTEAWQAHEPDSRRPWDLKWAGHLHRRAGFGASLEELKAAVARGLPATLERLLQGQPAAADDAAMTRLGQNIVRRDNPGELRGWWLYRMVYTPHPLREKMTLFWHNHFATSLVKVQRLELMFQQNQTLREQALGKFGPLLQAISRDPAMLLYLDSNSNVKGKPNENYAREVMELFSLGVGNYTEKDIREAARAFTGWQTDGKVYRFNADEHDSDAKTVLGQTGNWNGDDIVRICLQQPACARFLVKKLYRYFISETAEPPAALLEPLAEAFRKSDYDIAALVKRILVSRHLFSDYAYRQRIKSPVEYLVGAALSFSPTIVPPGAMVRRLETLGQQLFAPPNVKGWVFGEAWLNTSTVLARANFAQALAAANGDLKRDAERAGQRPDRFAFEVEAVAKVVEELDEPIDASVDPVPLVRKAAGDKAEAVVHHLLDLLLQGDVSEAARKKVIAYVADGKSEEKDQARRIREAIHAIMIMPEYQLA